MSKNPIIKIEKLRKKYNKKDVLKGIDLIINKGDRIALIGGNGSGKTTLVEIIAGIRKITSGKVKINSNTSVGIQFQENDYPLGITVKALIDFYLDKYENKITKKDVEELLEVFRLKKQFKKQIFYLSGGQKQRLNIFLAVIHKPDILILDELSTGLDIKIRADLEKYVIDYLKKHQDITLILVTHTIGEVQQLTNRVLVLNWGEIVEDRFVDSILKENSSMEDYFNQLFVKMYREHDLKSGKIIGKNKNKNV